MTILVERSKASLRHSDVRSGQRPNASLLRKYKQKILYFPRAVVVGSDQSRRRVRLSSQESAIRAIFPVMRRSAFPKNRPVDEITSTPNTYWVRVLRLPFHLQRPERQALHWCNFE